VNNTVTGKDSTQKKSEDRLNKEQRKQNCVEIIKLTMVITKKVDYKIKLLESNTLPWNQVKYLKTI
jgi:hypothetical protein